jgi:DNA-binding response OmpR family regulator
VRHIIQTIVATAELVARMRAVLRRYARHSSECRTTGAGARAR